MDPSDDIDLHTLPAHLLVDIIDKLKEENKSQHERLITNVVISNSLSII